MPEFDIELEETGDVYFVPVVRFEVPTPQTEEAPIGWMPVFRTAEAAQGYAIAKTGNPSQVASLSLTRIFSRAPRN